MFYKLAHFYNCLLAVLSIVNKDIINKYSVTRRPPQKKGLLSFYDCMFTVQKPPQTNKKNIRIGGNLNFLAAMFKHLFSYQKKKRPTQLDRIKDEDHFIPGRQKRSASLSPELFKLGIKNSRFDLKAHSKDDISLNTTVSPCC